MGRETGILFIYQIFKASRFLPFPVKVNRDHPEDGRIPSQYQVQQLHHGDEKQLHRSALNMQ